MMAEYEYSGRYAIKPRKGTPEFYMKDLHSIKVAIKGNYFLIIFMLFA